MSWQLSAVVAMPGNTRVGMRVCGVLGNVMPSGSGTRLNLPAVQNLADLRRRVNRRDSRSTPESVTYCGSKNDLAQLGILPCKAVTAG